MLKALKECCAGESPRPVTSGIGVLEHNGKLSYVSLDGKTLLWLIGAAAETARREILVECGFDYGRDYGPGCVLYLHRETSEIGFEEYPDFRQVIPKETTNPEKDRPYFSAEIMRRCQIVWNDIHEVPRDWYYPQFWTTSDVAPSMSYNDTQDALFLTMGSKMYGGQKQYGFKREIIANFK